MIKTALITGISGQDGSYLAEYLLEQNYQVHGIIRRHSVAENQNNRIVHMGSDVTTHYGDLLDEYSIMHIINEVKPTHIFNLAAMSHVRISTELPAFTIKTNGLGVLNMLESCKQIVPNASFYQASSSEMFGNSVDSDGYQRITTPMKPVSPYGCSKLMGYHLVRHYRHAYNIHACNGILFNHESPRRGSNFVTNKVCKTAAEIYHGLTNVLELGNLDSYRDWGHSYDYVRAIEKIINHSEPNDWVVATGETRSVRDMCEIVFKHINLDYRDYVVQNTKYMRPEELEYLKGDASDTRNELNWKPTYTFEQMMREMTNHWISKIGKELEN